MDLKSKYAGCSHINRAPPEVAITQEIEDKLSKSYRILPMFEKAIADHVVLKANSLQTNKILLCRWREYARLNNKEKPEPCAFPNIKDFHFYNYNTRYMPNQSIAAISNYRLSLKGSPGIDKYGELPIPVDVVSRKSGTIVHQIKRIKPTPKIKTIVRSS